MFRRPYSIHRNDTKRNIRYLFKTGKKLGLNHSHTITVYEIQRIRRCFNPFVLYRLQVY
jgi:hypothetical protein